MLHVHAIHVDVRTYSYNKLNISAESFAGFFFSCLHDIVTETSDNVTKKVWYCYKLVHRFSESQSLLLSLGKGEQVAALDMNSVSMRSMRCTRVSKGPELVKPGNRRASGRRYSNFS